MTDPERPTRAARRAAADGAEPTDAAQAPGSAAVGESVTLSTGATPMVVARADAAQDTDVLREPATEAPTADVAAAEDAPRLPGEHRGGFARLPTAPVDVTIEAGPTLVDTSEWIQPQRPTTGLAAWALTGGILGLLISFFVGWGFPIGLAGAIAAVVALGRPLESRAVAIWALVLSILSIVYSAGWLLWAAYTASLIG